MVRRKVRCKVWSRVRRRVQVARLAAVGTAVTLLALGATACTNTALDPRFACTLVAVPGLAVTVMDSLTGKPKVFTGLWARARDGVYADSLGVDLGDVVKGSVTISLAYEHKGTFNVAVHADGYQLWTATGVVVTADECHVQTVSLTARLVQ